MPAKKIGYARISKFEHETKLEAQERELREAGCVKLFSEQVPSVNAPRWNKFDAALDYLRKGDTLVVSRLDRLCRSSAHLWEVLQQLKSKGARLRILDLGVDTGSAKVEMVLTILCGIAAFERSILLERRREGLAKASVDRANAKETQNDGHKLEQIEALQAQGVSVTEIVNRLGISRATVYRIIANSNLSELS